MSQYLYVALLLIFPSFTTLGRPSTTAPLYPHIIRPQPPPDLDPRFVGEYIPSSSFFDDDGVEHIITIPFVSSGYGENNPQENDPAVVLIKNKSETHDTSISPPSIPLPEEFSALGEVDGIMVAIEEVEDPLWDFLDPMNSQIEDIDYINEVDFRELPEFSTIQDLTLDPPSSILQELESTQFVTNFIDKMDEEDRRSNSQIVLQRSSFVFKVRRSSS